MAPRTPALAKLTRPRLHDALPRPRLFALLDAAVASRPIVWVGAPPGAGKSTLVAGWLEARGRRHLWYQIDAGDASPATFVHYMQLALQPLAGRRARGTGLFPPQPQQEPGSFARAFFRDLFAQLPAGCVLVLDNFHAARTLPEQRAALAQGLEEMPEGATLIVVSRTDPPPEFARLAAGQRIARIDASALRCSDEEAAAILGAGDSPDERTAGVQRQADGWVAALVLWREHLRGAGGRVDEAVLGAGRDAVFSYFAGEIFQRATPAERRLLMVTAVAPSVSAADARALTGDAAAPRLLESLFRRHLFVDRRAGTPPTYHYHALFREFLQGEAQRRLEPEELRALTASAAQLLAARGQVHDALELAQAAGDWATLRTLIDANALEWARQGRAQALSDWIDALPAEWRAADPWLAYWQGRAWIFVQPLRGRPALERAFDGFRAAGDRRGQALALATLVTGSYYEWADFRPLDRWLPELDRLLAASAEGAGEETLDRGSELRARAAHVIALLFRRPGDPELARSAARLDELLDAEPDPNVRLMAASILFNHYNWAHVEAAAAALVARTEPVVASREAGPLMQVWWRTHLSFWHYLNGRYERSAEVAAEARTIAERYGLEAYLFEIDHARAEALISQGDLLAAKTLVDGIERRLSPLRRMDLAYFHNLRSTLRQRLGLAAGALHDAQRSLTLAHETGLPTLQIPTFTARVAQARAGVGDLPGALETLGEAMAMTAGAGERRSFERMRELLLVELQLDRGDVASARAGLAAVLADYRGRGQRVFMRNRPDAAARLADFALVQGIEPDYVRDLIGHNRLVAPPGASAAWPFRLRIHALGGFALERDGAPLRFSGKAQQRPLDLLKLLVALGGRAVDSQALTDALWPDADGAAAKTSFDSTLFRLRKLLDIEDLIDLSGGKLTLSRTLAWSDVDALEQALDAAALRDGDAAALERAAQQLLEAWRGPLLGQEEPTWVLQPRDALRARVLSALGRLGERLERAGAAEAASALYRRALEADNLAESLHRALMRSLAAAGQRAEAIAAYRRCRELLQAVLGIAPSAQTEALYRELTGRGAAPAS
ncbi:MAG: hypothetical protein KF830_18290 [Planctomycetes bacterium]|nr:hypothetical protein [Planctomycetota bacterium]